MNTQEIQERIAAAEASIAKAQPLADKLAAMQQAAATIAQADSTLGILRGQLAEAKAQERVLANALRNLRIVSVRPSNPQEASAGRAHVVEMHEMSTGLDGRQEATPMKLALHGLSAMQLAVLVAQAAKQPELIPPYIRVLDADPEQALQKHAGHVRRGHMAG